MADLEPVIAEADWSALAGAVTRLGRQRALVVLLTPLEPSAVEEGLLPVLPTLTRHHRVVLASVRDPALERLAAARGTVDEVYDAAAAEQAWSRRRRTAELLRALGVDVVDADAERLPPAWPTTTSPSRRTACCEPARLGRPRAGGAALDLEPEVQHPVGRQRDQEGAEAAEREHGR